MSLVRAAAKRPTSLNIERIASHSGNWRVYKRGYALETSKPYVLCPT